MNVITVDKEILITDKSVEKLREKVLRQVKLNRVDLKQPSNQKNGKIMY